MDRVEKIKIKENKNRNFFNKNSNTIKMKYPHILDSKLQSKITLKKEFQYHYNGEIKDIQQEDKLGNLCNTNDENFSLAPHQEFVKTFINKNTPYNGLLLYHGMGSGKTCSVMGITEEFRKSNKYNSEFKKIIIVASPNVQENFKTQLFNHTKLIKKNNLWNLGGCVGSALLQELKDYNIQDMEKDEISKKIKKIIKKNYYFMGYEQFANKIFNLINISSNNIELKTSIIKKRLFDEFNGAMIVIDEAHNVRLSGDKLSKKVASALIKLVQNVKKMKLLLLSGTPMYNDPKEILFLLNILNMNDGHSIIYNKEVFDKYNNLLVDKNNQIGKKKLIQKSNGYISYVRGENPYSFPFKIYPNDYNSKFSLFNNKYPKLQFNNKKIETPITNLDLFLNTISDIQKKGYLQIIDKIYSDIENGDINDFETKEAFSYTTLQSPINALNIVYPNYEDDESFLIGKEGLMQIVSNNNNKYKYVSSDPFFTYDTIGNFSCKIKSILEHIIASDGIILIYSQYLDAGLVPIALCLEELGFNRAKQDNLLEETLSSEKFNVLNMSNNKQDSKQKFKQATYAMITGDNKPKGLSINNNAELELLNDPKNINGELCKVVLISNAGSEGLDFKNLRQVHILEPWYNLNRIEQIIGRAIRNCSHKNLPLNERNTQIFLHGTNLNDNYEAIDLFMYRFAEQKSKKIGEIQKILKSVSVDCLLNQEQTNFANLDQTLKLKLSNQSIIDFNIKDKPFSSICDYQKECFHECFNKKMANNELNKSSFSYNHLLHEQIIDKIKKLFLKNHVYKRNVIIDIISNKNINVETIDYALSYLIDNKEIIIDKYIKKGYLINIKDLYVFQPMELNTYLSLHQRQKPMQKKINVLKVDKLDEFKLNQIQNSSKKPIITQKKKIKLKDKSKNLIKSNASTKFKKLIDDIFNNFSIGMQDMSIKKGETDYYKSFSETINVINEKVDNIDISVKQKEELLIHHILEDLQHKDELLLVEFLYKNKLNDFENKLKQYYDQFIFNYKDSNYIFLTNLQYKKDKTNLQNKKDKTNLQNKKDKLFVFEINIALDEESSILRKISEIEYNDFDKSILNKFTEIKKTHNSYIGFNDYYQKLDAHMFKIKDTNDPKSKGANFDSKSPIQMLKIINSIIGNEIFDKKMKLNKKQLTIICEIIMKYYDIINFNNKKYYYNKMEFLFYV